MTLLQTQEIDSDPITWSLAFLGVYHAFFGVLYCSVLLFYFKSDDTRMVKYFLACFRVCITSEAPTFRKLHSLIFRMSETARTLFLELVDHVMLALPATATS